MQEFKLRRNSKGAVHLTSDGHCYDITFSMAKGSGFDLDDALRRMKDDDVLTLTFQSNVPKETRGGK